MTYQEPSGCEPDVENGLRLVGLLLDENEELDAGVRD